MCFNKNFFSVDFDIYELRKLPAPTTHTGNSLFQIDLENQQNQRRHPPFPLRWPHFSVYEPTGRHTLKAFIAQRIWP